MPYVDLRSDIPGSSVERNRLSLLMAVTIGCAMVLASKHSWCDMSSQFGLSPRAIGMGNAVSALIDDYAAVYYNPAGLALTSESGFTLGYFYNEPRIKVGRSDGTEHSGFRSAMKAGLIGYRHALFSKHWKKNVVVGMALAYPDNFKTGTMVRTYFYDDTQWPVVGRVHDMLVMSGGMGIQVHERVYVGVGMRFAVTYSAQDINVVLRLSEGTIEYERVDINADTEVLPVVGCIIRPLEWLKFGAVWRRGGAPVKVVGKGQGSAVVGAFVLPVSLGLNFKDFYEPDEIAASVAIEPLDKMAICFETTYAFWSKYDVPFDMKPPGRPLDDIVIPRIGLEYRLSDFMRVQAGYYYHPSPVKRVQSDTDYLDAAAHVVSAGAEFSIPIPRLLEFPLVLHVCAQYEHMPERRLTTLHGSTRVWGHISTIGGTVQLRF